MKCQFTKPNQEQYPIHCNANAMADFEYCFSHNPETQSDKRAAVIKGGLAPKPRKEAERLEPVSIKNTKDILALIEDTVNRVRSEPMTHQKANSIGYLSTVALKAMEIDELDEKLEFVKSFILERKNKK